MMTQSKKLSFSRNFHPILCFTDTEPGGAPRVTLDVARCFREHRIPVTLVFPKKGVLEKKAREEEFRVLVLANPPVSIRDSGILVKLRLIKKRITYIYRLGKLARKIRRQTKKQPVIWAGSYFLPECMVAGRLSGTRTVLHVHETPQPSRSTKLRLWLLSKTTDHYVFVTRSGLPHFPDIPDDKFSVIRNRVHLTGLDDYSVIQSESGPFNITNEVRVLAVGYITEVKGFDLLIKAIDLIKKQNQEIRIKLQIAGDDPDSGSPTLTSLKNLVQELKLEESVEFLGNQENISTCYQNSDLFVLSSRTEAMPLSLIEAISMNCPVVATNVGGVGEVIKDGKTGTLVEPGNPELLAKGILKNLESPQRHDWASDAQKLIQKEFNSKSIASRYVKVLNRLSDQT